jgi:hypothetical protein
MSDVLYAPRQFRLLVVGSRHATPDMLNKAGTVVERARANGWAILVGDADGVDTAVIAACNRVGVNYAVFGISTRPRSQAFRDIEAGGTGRYIRHIPHKSGDYSARDRFMVDVADRVLCLWNGTSKGTKAAYEYAKSLGKPVDLLTFSAPHQASAPTPLPSAKPHPSTVELVVSVTPQEDGMHGVLGLRALDGKGAVLYQVRDEIALPDVQQPDYAKLRLILCGLERLRTRLGDSGADYTLHIVQSSKHIEGWMQHGWKRNADAVIQLTGAADALLSAFPTREWVKMPKAQVTSLLSKLSDPIH